MFTKKGVIAQGCSWEDAHSFNNVLKEFLSLEGELFSDDVAYSEYRVSENLYIFSKSLFLRLSELGNSIPVLFNEGHIVSTLIIARAIFETDLFLTDFEKQIKRIVDLDKVKNNVSTDHIDVSKIDDLVLQKMFSTRRSDLLEDEEFIKFEFTNIKTLIEKHSKDDFKNTLYEYETLCEYTHPNVLGHLLAYTKTDLNTGLMKFEKTFAHEKGIFQLLKLAFLNLQKSGFTLKLLVLDAEFLRDRLKT